MTTTTDIPQALDTIDDSAFYTWQDEMIAKREDAESYQRAFLVAMNAASIDVYKYLLNLIPFQNFKNIEGFLPGLPAKLSVGSMPDLPPHDEREISIYLTQNGVYPVAAANSAFWAYCHIKWIGQEMFEIGQDGIFGVFCQGAKKPDAQMRNFLRRTGGLRGVRGYVSVLNDCPMSRSWWRYRLAVQISETLQLEPSISDSDRLNLEVVQAWLRVTNVWPNFVEMAVHRVTSINIPRARAALVVAFSREGDFRNVKLKPNQVRSAIAALGRLSYGYNLHLVPWDMLVEAATEGIAKPLELQKTGGDQDKGERDEETQGASNADIP